MYIPDVLGYILDDAKSLLENSGYEVDVVMTKPPRSNPGGTKRVVKVKTSSSGKVVLTVVCEETGKGGVLNGL
ncbi:hypothetical protein Desca_1510 [Desulfotomaculum nigrificans CO-1-SRB]|uniref:PASTA domain-containing protein n=1 Tax=Desulfotomaculum nigrificans (strain DSM 14880 / VKM B-2319 / CO-1-SRB) TaxID=868595 RepID=F6B6J1_DESCC|nr:hypothetical protein Desca_1510 [Desulfotomaculum nigrificans CO-1-SRB]